MSKLRVFEAFSGYGSQSMSLRDMNVEHEMAGISEIEPDAIIAYGSIRFDLNDLHTDKTHDEMREELIAKNVGKDFKTGKSKIPRMKKDKLEMLYKFDKAANNFGDVSIINPTDLPDFDYFTYSFPCTDISVSGKQEGIVKGGTRSGLLYECEKIIENKKPKYLLMENVKNLVGKSFRGQFDEWCEYLEGLGYTNYHNNYKCLNAKNFQIAQNRERIFMFSVLGEHDEYVFPQGEKLTKRLKDFLEESVEDKYYLSEEIQKRFKKTKGNIEIPQATKKGYIELEVPGVADLSFPNSNTRRGRVQECGSVTPTIMANNQELCVFEEVENGAIRGRYNEDGKIEQQLELRDDAISNTITTVQKDNVVVINEKETFEYNPSGENVIGTMGGDLWTKRHEQIRRVYDIETISPTIPTSQGGGVQPKILEDIKINRLGGLYDTEDRLREAGAVFDREGLSPTLNTAQGGYRMPLTIEDIKIEKVGNLECKGWHEIETRVHSTEGLAPTVETRNRAKYLEHNTICEQRCDEGLRFFKDDVCGTIRTINSGGDKRVIETEPSFRIRKLTPKECLRLMGVSDEDIGKMQSVGLSDSALYKLAGNSIVKQVLDALHVNMFKKVEQSTPSGE